MSGRGYNKVHEEAGGQVGLYQKGDLYLGLLEKRHGQRFLDYRAQWRERGQRRAAGDFPLSLDLGTNSGCQLKCLMCPLPSRPAFRTFKAMDERLYARLMDEAREHRLPALTLGLASEPLLNPRTARHIEKAVRAGVMDIRLGTNGLALSPESNAALIDSGLTRLEISVDAVDGRTYAAIRQGGDLEKLERNIHDFLDLRAKKGQAFPLLRLSFLRLPQNALEEQAFLDKWDGLADMLSLQECIWFPGSGLPWPAKKLRAQWKECAQSFQRLGVLHDGQAWPCCSWHGAGLLGLSLENMAAAQIWNSGPMKSLREALLNDAPPAPCLNCLF